MMTLNDLFDVSDTRKRALLQQTGVLGSLQHGIKNMILQDLLISARIHCISKIELYFLQHASQLKQPLNLRNEAAAVSLLLLFFTEAPAAAAEAAPGGTTAHHAKLLDALLKYSCTLWPELASGDITLSSIASEPTSQPCTETGSSGSLSSRPATATPLGQPAPPGSAAANFEQWAKGQGVGAAVTIASFGGGLRGCAASRDVEPGDLLLSIPRAVLIYEDTVKQTDLGRMLHAIPGLTIDNLLIIFTMVDRHDEESWWAPYWRSLPDKYYTGLSFPQQLVDALAGTAAHLELTRAQQHLRQQYADTRPLFDMLLAAYPQHLKAEWFEYDCYLWAAELWYSYAFDIEFPDAPAALQGSSQPAQGAKSTPGTSESSSNKGSKGSKSKSPSASRTKGSGSSKLRSSSNKSRSKGSGSSRSSTADTSKPVMVPFACHVNHSPWPHCVRYGRLNPSTQTLDFPAFRPCQQGQQASKPSSVFISYGPVPNLKLLCYYGFVVPSNPHDLVPLTLEPPEGPQRAQQLDVLQSLELGLEHSLQDGPLSKQLLACLRIIVATPAELASVRDRQVDPMGGPVAPDNEDQALRTLEAALLGLLSTLDSSPLLAEPAPPPAVGAAAGGGAGGATSGTGGGPAASGSGTVCEDRRFMGQAGLAEAERQLGHLALDAQQSSAAVGGAGRPCDSDDGGPHSGSGGACQHGCEHDEKQISNAVCNENGFDAGWRMSRRFCRLYVEGQRHILRRSLQECHALLQQLRSS